MRRVCIALIVLALLPAMPARGVDIDRPAQLRLLVTDDQGQPLPQARVRWFGPEPHWPERPKPALELTTDDTGSLLLERTRPIDAASIDWSERFHVELEGYLSLETGSTIRLFPGAELSRTLSVDRERVTRVRLRGPRGEPLPRVSLLASYGRGGYERTQFLLTDENGEARWRHGSLDERFSITAKSDLGFWTDGADVPQGDLHQNGDVITITYKDATLPLAARRLEGKLLQADGSVAEGWLVARQVHHLGGSGIIHGPMYENLRMEQLRRVGPDGRFDADIDSDALLAIVSPAGIPLLYALSPRSWQPATRHLTLRLSAPRRVHQGVVVDEVGQPVAGLPIELDSLRWNGANWTFTPGAVSAQWQATSRHASAPAINSIQTDSEGKYSIPIYAGSTAVFQTFRQGVGSTDADGFEVSERVVWKRRRQRGDPIDPEQYKQLTLVFVDEQGEPLSVTPRAEGYAGDQLVYNRGGGLRDTHGVHLFLPRAVDRLELSTDDPQKNWNPLQATFDITAADDQVIRVTMDESIRLKPLTGTVLAPDGHPVPDARVSLLKPEAAVRDRYNIYLGMQTATDADGKFAFSAAPDHCRIDIRRSAPDGGLPGWMTPLVIDRQNRDVTVRLKRGGTVKVLLPTGMGEAATSLFLQREDMPREAPLHFVNEYLQHDADRNELVSGAIRPGAYVVQDWSSALTLPLAAAGTVRAAVETGEETIVDLRELGGDPLPMPIEPPKSWNTVVVERQGEVVSGAEVMLYAAAAKHEELTQWMQQWKSGDAALRKAALTRLIQAGALAIDAITASQDEAFGVDRLVRDRDDLDFHDRYEPSSDGLQWLAQDISDEAGTVRCEIAPGLRCVAVARMRGRLVGWKSFVAEGDAVIVELRPARTLRVRLDAAAAEHDERSDDWPHLRLEQPVSLGTRALMSVLTDANTRWAWGQLPLAAVLDREYAMQADGPATWILEDLPIGTQWTVTLRNRYFDGLRDHWQELQYQPRELGRITIEPGEATQSVQW